MRVASKYHNQPAWSELCQRTFHSKAERERGEGLRLRELAGDIEDLRYQVAFTLGRDPYTRRPVKIIIDFAYHEDGKEVYEDVKGKMTKDARVKLSWLAAQGVHVEIVKA